MVMVFSSPPFYTTFVHLPNENDCPPEIRNNSKFWPFFKDVLGALDGSHIHCSPPAHICGLCRNRKGFISQNCLFASSFDMQFTYSLCGWEGSASDARVFADAKSDFIVPEGKYYLADAGFPSCDELLIPYRGVRYHLAEWGRAGVR
jgi:DDE superfamily endonuclease